MLSIRQFYRQKAGLASSLAALDHLDLRRSALGRQPSTLTSGQRNQPIGRFSSLASPLRKVSTGPQRQDPAPSVSFFGLHGLQRRWKVYSSRTSITPSPLSIPDFLLEDIDRWGDIPALVNGVTESTISFHELGKQIRKVATSLSQRGLKKGDVVLISGLNCPEYIVAVLGILKSGGIVSPASPSFTTGEVLDQIKDSNSTWAIVHPATKNSALPAAQQAGLKVDRLFIFPEEGETTPGVQPWSSLISIGDAEIAAPNISIDAEKDLAFLPYSSGTTGKPKGVMLSHRNLTANMLQVGAVEPRDAGATTISLLPYFHIYGLFMALWNLRDGVTGVVMPQFDPQRFLHLVQSYKPQLVFIVPPLVLFLSSHPLVEKYDVSSLRWLVSGAAPLTITAEELLEKRIKDCRVKQAYGMTESSPVTLYTQNSQVVPGSVGQLVPSTEMKIVNPETDEELGEHQQGEIWMRGPQVMLGYLNRPEATRATLTPDGFLRTGDVGYVTETGNVFITDRIKDLIKYKGHQVCPTELEDVVLKHPAVHDVAVVGVLRPEDGQEIPKAFVQLKPSATATEEEIMDFVAGQVDPIKKLRALQFVEQIPRTASGKILRRTLRHI